MPAANFANAARNGPNPTTVPHPGGGNVGYTCHMAAVHWAFMDLGDTSAIANARLTAIGQARCPGCTAGAPAHISIPHPWYGTNFCAGAGRIGGRDALYAAVNVGDVVVVGNPASPAHSMVIVRKRRSLGRNYVYIRGFNNTGTLGTGAHLAYDGADRDIDRGRFWHTQGGQTRFGLGYAGGGELHLIPYAIFSQNAATVRNNCNNAAGAWVYTGP